jgi:hypothetical protein
MTLAVLITDLPTLLCLRVTLMLRVALPPTARLGIVQVNGSAHPAGGLVAPEMLWQVT